MIDPLDIPVYINNRDRLTTTKALVDWLIGAGQRHIVIMDNKSTYPPLLKYYQKLTDGVRLHFFPGNHGPWSFWTGSLYREQSLPYIVTDSDLVPAEDCPKDLIQKLYSLLTRFPNSGKVGPGLKITDVPDDLCLYSGWDRKGEEHFWTKRFNDEAFNAPLDTTFALYPAGTKDGDSLKGYHNLRMDSPYLVRHMPWYARKPFTEEERYYREHVGYDVPNQNSRYTAWTHIAEPI